MALYVILAQQSPHLSRQLLTTSPTVSCWVFPVISCIVWLGMSHHHYHSPECVKFPCTHRYRRHAFGIVHPLGSNRSSTLPFNGTWSTNSVCKSSLSIVPGASAVFPNLLYIKRHSGRTVLNPNRFRQLVIHLIAHKPQSILSLIANLRPQVHF